MDCDADVRRSLSVPGEAQGEAGWALQHRYFQKTPCHFASAPAITGYDAWVAADDFLSGRHNCYWHCLYDGVTHPGCTEAH